MNKQTSLYLDLVRFLAALVVFLSHASSHRLTDGFLWQLGPYGDEAVDVFFVLSGFVIAFVTDTKERSSRDYAISRAARIYSVAFPALIVTFCLDMIGRHFDPALYTSDWGYEWNGRLIQFIRGITFTNQLWFQDARVGSDLSYWSLGFEVWYYITFGLLFFARGRLRLIALIVSFIIMGPTIIVLMPIWLIGTITYYLLKKLHIPKTVSGVLFLSSIIAWVAYEEFARHLGRPTRIAIFGSRRIGQDYLIGVFFSLNLIGFYGISQNIGHILILLQKPIRWLAGATFTLYLFHLPILQFLAALSPWPSASIANRLLVICMTLMAIFAIAEMTERRKDIWYRLFSLIIPVKTSLRQL